MENSNYLQGKQFFSVGVIKYSNNRYHQRWWNLYRRYSEHDLNSPEPALSKLAVLSGAGLETEGDSFKPLSFCNSASFRTFLVLKAVDLEK